MTNPTADPLLQLLRYGYAASRVRGLSVEDAEDCAVSFVEKQMPDGRENRSGLDPSPPWLSASLQHHITDWVRVAVRNGRRQCAFDEAVVIDERGSAIEPTEPDSAVSVVIHAELSVLIAIGLAALPPAQQDVLRRYYLFGDSAPEIAGSTGKSVTAIEQMLVRARRALRRELLRSGVDWPAASDYLAIVASPPPPPILSDLLPAELLRRRSIRVAPVSFCPPESF